MALFHTTVVDNQIKALSTIGSASGSIATFETDKADRLVSCVCEVASGSSEINVYACGVNLWNENWELGDIKYSDGSNIPSSTWIRSADYCPIKGGQTYYIKSTEKINMFFYDKNKSYLGQYSGGLIQQVRNESRTISANAFYFRIATLQATYNYDISINYTSTDTQYHAYNGTTYNIQFGETLSDTATYDATSGVLTRNNSTTKQLDSCNIVTLDNETNNVYCDTGNTEVNYILSVGQAIS